MAFLGCSVYSILSAVSRDDFTSFEFEFLSLFFFSGQLLWLELSVQFSHSVVSDSLWPHEPQNARPPCPSPTPGVHPNPCPLSQWCHPTISSSVILFSSCPQYFPASESFQMSQLFASGGESIGVSASASVLPMNIQDSSPTPQFKSINSLVLSFLGWMSNSHIHIWPLEKPYPWLDRHLLTK